MSSKQLTLTQQCLDILKNENFKNEVKLLLRPAMNFLLFEIHPYVYILILIFISSFFLNLATCILLLQLFFEMKKKQKDKKIK